VRQKWNMYMMNKSILPKLSKFVHVIWSKSWPNLA